MSSQNPVCEHCGHLFEASPPPPRLTICPACGLNAHPYGDNRDIQIVISRKKLRTFLIGSLLAALLLALLILQILSTSRIRHLTDEAEAMHELLAELENKIRLTDYPSVQATEPTVTPVPPPAAPDKADGDEPVFTTPSELNLYRRLKVELDNRVPAYQVGEIIRLRQTNGRILRGVMTEVEPDAVVIKLDNGLENAFYFESLDHDSRARVDPAFREEAIRRQMQRITTSPREPRTAARRTP